MTSCRRPGVGPRSALFRKSGYAGRPAPGRVVRMFRLVPKVGSPGTPPAARERALGLFRLVPNPRARRATWTGSTSEKTRRGHCGRSALFRMSGRAWRIRNKAERELICGPVGPGGTGVPCRAAEFGTRRNTSAPRPNRASSTQPAGARPTGARPGELNQAGRPGRGPGGRGPDGPAPGVSGACELRRCPRRPGWRPAPRRARPRRWRAPAGRRGPGSTGPGACRRC